MRATNGGLSAFLERESVPYFLAAGAPRPAPARPPTDTSPGLHLSALPVRLPIQMLLLLSTWMECPGLAIDPRTFPVARSIFMILPASPTEERFSSWLRIMTAQSSSLGVI